MISQVYDFRTNYLRLESWKNWYVNLVMNDGLVIRRGKNRQQQSKDGQKGATNVVYEYDDELAIEVFKYRKALVDFGESSVTRAPRPSRVQFRVGQVVRHKQLDLVGVIIGWDERAQAPISWIQRNYVDEDERDRYVQQPHYLILVDEKFQAKYSGKAYVVQDDIEVVQNNQVGYLISAKPNERFIKIAYLIFI